MKHLKPRNHKAERAAAQAQDDLVGMNQPVGCTTIFNPGWEPTRGGTSSMCAPVEADLLSCANVCWWPAQVPDSLQNTPEWAKACSGSTQEDWRSLEVAFPKID